ncbi:MAG: hypothetical protein FJ386_12880 [Verrucomicrobia bacterium]|nr:hypothetical protein [Verrucomicrobiota bacterium]
MSEPARAWKGHSQHPVGAGGVKPVDGHHAKVDQEREQDDDQAQAAASIAGRIGGVNRGGAGEKHEGDAVQLQAPTGAG